LPLIPEIIGHFSNDLLLPWSGESQITLEESDQARTPEEVIPEILEKAWNLESDPDALKVTQDLVEYYSDKLNLLVICNNESFPIRPEYSAEIPLISSKKAKS
ncbi:MAG: hypothetical protein K8F91_14380, partial [Candidatus Obscuribacterales bacterium]|nr:hypothetical protein [Candidatus Obscuribacterales bacterium]